MGPRILVLIPMSGLLLLAACRDLGDYMGGVDEDGDGYYANGENVGPRPTDDCNDGNPDVTPDADEVCDNGIDDDCAFSDDCYQWDSANLHSHDWESEDGNCRFGDAIASITVDGSPISAVSAPCGTSSGLPGSVYLIPWADPDASSGLDDVPRITGSEVGDRLGKALLSDVALLGDEGGRYLLVGAPAWGGYGAIFALNVATLTFDSTTLTESDVLFQGEAGAEVGEVLAWTELLQVGEGDSTLLMGDPYENGLSIASCSSEGGTPSCEPFGRLSSVDLENEPTGLGADLAVLSSEGGDRAWLVVAAPVKDEVWIYGPENLQQSNSVSSQPPLMRITGRNSEVISMDISIEVADVWPGAHSGTPDLIIGWLDDEVVQILDGDQLIGDLDNGRDEPSTDATVAWIEGSELSFGETLSAGRDIDGDGVPDLLIGAPAAADGAGAVWILPSTDAEVRTADGWDLSGARLITGASEVAGIGAALAAVPSMNDDGALEVFIGAPTDSHIMPNAGSLSVVIGPSE